MFSLYPSWVRTAHLQLANMKLRHPADNQPFFLNFSARAIENSNDRYDRLRSVFEQFLLHESTKTACTQCMISSVNLRARREIPRISDCTQGICFSLRHRSCASEALTLFNDLYCICIRASFIMFCFSPRRCR